jgi:hypothetical protein
MRLVLLLNVIAAAGCIGSGLPPTTPGEPPPSGAPPGQPNTNTNVGALGPPRVDLAYPVDLSRPPVDMSRPPDLTPGPPDLAPTGWGTCAGLPINNNPCAPAELGNTFTCSTWEHDLCCACEYSAYGLQWVCYGPHVFSCAPDLLPAPSDLAQQGGD